MKKISFLLTMATVLTSMVFVTGCQQSVNANGSPSDKHVTTESKLLTPYYTSPEWNNYWYQGKAELTSYNLMQSRYGEIHQGTVVNIFVTEDFSREKQVKLNDPSTAGKDKLPILKLNQSIKFNTGIYPYSMMLSVYQPVDLNNYPHAIKVTGSVQEWCGMVYYQMNNRDHEYTIESRSYFETEGDRNVKLKEVIQEDELMTMIRINPSELPTGEKLVLPGALYLRLGHQPIEAVKSNMEIKNENGISTYSISMPSLNRKLNIRFEQIFPYRILGWDDTYPGLDGKLLTTTATSNKAIMLDYWRTHTNNDRVLREQLGIPKDSQ